MVSNAMEYYFFKKALHTEWEVTIILLWGLWFKSCIHPDELQKSVLFVSPRILGGFQVVSCKKAVCITKAITEITWAIFPRPTLSAISRTLEGLLTGERTDLIIEWVPSSWCQCSGYTSIKTMVKKDSVDKGIQRRIPKWEEITTAEFEKENEREVQERIEREWI